MSVNLESVDEPQFNLRISEMHFDMVQSMLILVLSNFDSAIMLHSNKYIGKSCR
jgi:hypothetical protein